MPLTYAELEQFINDKIKDRRPNKVTANDLRTVFLELLLKTGDSGISVESSDDIPEGEFNLFFTDERKVQLEYLLNSLIAEHEADKNNPHYTTISKALQANDDAEFANLNNVDLLTANLVKVLEAQSFDDNALTRKDFVETLLSNLEAALKDGVAADGNTLNKLRGLITDLQNTDAVHAGQLGALQTLLTSDDVSLDTLQEIVDFIKANEADITSLLSGKVNVSDIYNGLDYLLSGKVLDARQGKALKDLIDANTSAISNKVDKVTGKQLSTEDYTTTEKTKLGGIAAWATANATNAELRDRSTHTGIQEISTINGLAAALAAKRDNIDTAFTTALKFDKDYNLSSVYTITGAVAFTLNTTGYQVGRIWVLHVVANGVNKPTFSSAFDVAWDDFQNVNGYVMRYIIISSGSNRATIDVRRVR